ncbi:MAG: sigma-70 family RNA polymerase sigma factor [Luteolibacter sp.]|uniref:RNA polymerase sigma factor n=1 Tax=Luteolibacter sp. TaxID=1962973 RepID=UPI003262FF08
MSQPAPNDFFATTRWTIVLAAGNSGTPQSADALEALCRSYWFPLYAYVRRRGHTKEDAEDLTQAFFADLLGRRDFAKTDSERGRFRAFLLASLKNFLANEWDKSQRLKRGGSITHFPLDWQSADTQFQIADAAMRSPDEIFDREWAVALLERVIVRLRDEWTADGKADRFERMKCFLTVGKGEIPFAQAAEEQGIDEGTLRVAVHRLRKRYREMLRNEVADTLADPAMVEEELAVLLGAFR